VVKFGVKLEEFLLRHCCLRWGCLLAGGGFRTPDGLLHVNSPDRRYTQEKTIGDSLRRSVVDAKDSRDVGKSTAGDYTN
jgi:hypothetical protein